ncbi:phage protein NinX family protein [Pseudomonas syringae]|uniref:DUF2591 domain-containing protein n=1 Tax=Pseudomonas syringae pv. pisi str. 1704B TaxID=629263 RepID=F3G881_PSESJ|nr:phage protein NinX family protein [Pseudomonas syringae]EGH43281.1 hypothetical protein PSYPI_13159 [Pseudomonas syringae pv. pisi str. 1704B]PYD15830.1 DUF2591 domain-containing protein [Pseudomonas syringae pv. pisi]PYD34342.1 DUF2591 domain-containing protein [Pseudomonas syringae pv. pisi]RMM20778.1 hypothetical protein ALQ82_02446 [Pseudomonas syringae pv. pisi]
MSEFTEVKTADLLGAALDWAVAKAEISPMEMPPKDRVWSKYCATYSPSTDWSQGGPLIDSYHMDFCCEHPETIGSALCDENGMYIDGRMMFGKTHLIAACRAIVASVLGETVSVPKELLS